jgi:signal transduction protein with GAF and PtsI domain
MDCREQCNLIVKLLGISNLLENSTDLEKGLKEVAMLTAQIVKAQQCSIMLLSEEEKQGNNESYLRVFAHYGNLPNSAYQEMVGLKDGIAGYVAATGKSLLIDDITQSEFAKFARYLRESNGSFMSVPILLGKEVIGVINGSLPTDKESFENLDLEMLNFIALFVGQSLHVSQLQVILNSRFVERAVVADLEETQPGKLLALNPNPTKLAKIVAKSFFRELTKAGFGPNQIIAIATEVLNLLQATLYKHKQRLERDEMD